MFDTMERKRSMRPGTVVWHANLPNLSGVITRDRLRRWRREIAGMTFVRVSWNRSQELMTSPNYVRVNVLQTDPREQDKITREEGTIAHQR